MRKKLFKVNVKSEKSKLVENRSHTVRTGSVTFYNPKTDYKRSAEKRRYIKDIAEY